MYEHKSLLKVKRLSFALILDITLMFVSTTRFSWNIVFFLPPPYNQVKCKITKNFRGS